MNDEKSSDKDLRIELCGHLRGQAFRLKTWHRPSYNVDWDHDHCSACMKKIWALPSSVDGCSTQEGYASLATAKWDEDYNWVCVECFADLAESQDWSVVDSNG